MMGGDDMNNLFKKIKESWRLLHQDIFVGDMRKQNMKACFFVGIAVALAASTTTTLNFLSNRDAITIATTITQAIGGIVIVGDITDFKLCFFPTGDNASAKGTVIKYDIKASDVIDPPAEVLK